MKFGFNVHREEVARVVVEAETVKEAAEQIAKAIEEGRDDWQFESFSRYEVFDDDGTQVIDCTDYTGVVRMF